MGNFLNRHRKLLFLAICLILVWGISSYQALPRMEDPFLKQRIALVTTRFPGASAQRVESLVTKKLEQELFEIEEIETIKSISYVGSSLVDIHLKDEVANVDEVWSRVRNRIADVAPQLPPGAGEPEYHKVETRAYTILAALTWEYSPPVNYATLRRLAEKLEDGLQVLSGTEKVELFGAPQEEIVVEINPTALAALDLTAPELSQQIQQSDAKVPAGQLYSPSDDLLIEVETELDSLERIRQIPIRYGESGFARLEDIALVRKGTREPLSELALIDGKPAIVLAVLMEPSQNIDRWVQTIRQSLNDFQTPRGVSLQIIFDQSRYVRTRLDGLFNNLLLGVLFVIASTILMMGWKSALVVGLALPLSVLMVFGGMRVLGIPLHQISVTGLVIALGLLIDNAIVVVDELHAHLQRGLKPQAAISESMSYLALPLLASTLTTVLAFMPIALLPGASGEFVRAIALVVILSLFSSLFLSLTVVPALTVSTYSKKYSGLPQPWWNAGFSSPRLTKTYQRTLDTVLAQPILGVLLALVLPIVGFVMAASLEEQFFPPADRDQFHIEFKLPPQASLEQTRSLVLQARELILRHPEIDNVHWFVGREAPAFYYSLPRGSVNRANYAHGFVQLKAENSPMPIETLQNELDRAFPSALIIVRQLEQGTYVFAPIELYLYGPDLAVLRKLGNQVRIELAQVANVTHTDASLVGSLPKLALRVDEEQARLAGLDNTVIAQQLDASLKGSLGGSVVEATEELPVRVRLSNSQRSDLDQIASLELLPTASSSDRSSVPLSTLGKIELVPELSAIPRRQGKRVNTVQAFISPEALPSTVLNDVKQRLHASGFQLPSGYSLEFGGESAERSEAVGNLMSTVGILLVLMVALLVFSFGSFRSAGIIVLVGICSIGLGLASLWWFGYPLGFMAILGTVSLVGVAINDSIVVLAALQSDPQARQGDCKAMRQVIVRSTRHVLTTTITTIAGFLPLLIDGGEFWPPLAVCVVGGVGGATLLALFFVPCTYLLLIRRR